MRGMNYILGRLFDLELKSREKRIIFYKSLSYLFTYQFSLKQMTNVKLDFSYFKKWKIIIYPFEEDILSPLSFICIIFAILRIVLINFMAKIFLTVIMIE